MLRNVLFAAILVATFFTSCSNDDNDLVKGPTIQIEADGTEKFAYGERRSFPVLITGCHSVSVSAPDGWAASVENNELIIVAPNIDDQARVSTGKVVLSVNGDNGMRAEKDFDVKAFYVLTFEDVPDQYLAGPSSYGENLYDGTYQGYLDPVSRLYLHTSADGFYNGGLAVSQWNDKKTAGYMNQCSVYYGTDGAKNGGAGDSKTFVMGYYSAYSEAYGESGSYMYFQDGLDNYVVDHAYFTNSTNAALSMEYGDSFAKVFSYEDADWFKLTITGENSEGVTTGTVEVYLADFRTAGAPGILKEWKYVDLTPLGKVSKIKFSMSSSDGQGIAMNTPAYFCMDNIAIEL